VIRNDYIMRLIAQLLKAMQQILKLKDSRRYDDALREVDLTMQRICGMNSQLVNGLSEESLVATLRAGAALDHGKALVLAELLKEEGDLLAALERPDEAFLRYYRSLYLYLEAFVGEDELRLPDYSEKIAAVVERLDEFVLPLEMTERLARYYEQEGDFASAEDTIGLLLDEDESEEARGVARRFYERMLDRSDEELAAGNLTRDEVRDEIARL
jgi:hypothetical protein